MKVQRNYVTEVNNQFGGRLDLWLSANTPDEFAFPVTDSAAFSKWLQFNLEHLELLFKYDTQEVWSIDKKPVLIKGDEWNGLIMLTYCNDGQRGVACEWWNEDMTPYNSVILPREKKQRRE